MNFVNEIISQDDRIKYGLDEVENTQPKGVWHPSSQWTINRERNYYLRQMWQSNAGAEADNDPEFIIRVFHLFLDGFLYEIRLIDNLIKRVEVKEEKFEKAFFDITQIKLNINDELDVSVLNILYQALKSRKGAGIYGEWITDYQVVMTMNGKEVSDV